MVSHKHILLIICCYWALMQQAVSQKQIDFELGVTRMNLDFKKKADDRKQILRLIKESGAKYVRLSGPKNSQAIPQVIDDIKYANCLGLQVYIALYKAKELFPPNERKVPFLNTKASYRFSSIDLESYTLFLKNILAEVKAQDAKLLGIEVFNEPNFGFNGDIIINKNKQPGIIINEHTQSEDVVFMQGLNKIEEGFNKYGQLLKITKEQINATFKGQEAPKVITASLSLDNQLSNWEFGRRKRVNVVDPGYFLRFLAGKTNKNETDYLQYADKIGTHYYPKLVNDQSEANEIPHRILSKITENTNKPILISEFGISRKRVNNENDRYQHFKIAIDALQNSALLKNEVVYIFSFDINDTHKIFDEGSLLPCADIYNYYN
ncbi:hypothetical protein [Saccharicrinis aurantiacus]|uniref:hypothetical protein n=1 Tax=Saccharicrinis aurantiacus TaxID=1849719 RepID=UPI001115111F|nr:hypothetical protein [Saccharicrinis aurantiacus]